MLPNKSKDMMQAFRNSRLNIQTQNEVDVPKKKKSTHVPPKNMRNTQTSSPYQSFLSKVDNLADSIDSFKTRDLAYYFREISERAGHRYVMTNIKKDMAIMKRLQENYTPREICGMIEFLFESEQDYLDKDRLSPNLLSSSWVNTIYADMKLWVEDAYVPKSKKKHKGREWTSSTEETSAKIGEWE